MKNYISFLVLVLFLLKSMGQSTIVEVSQKEKIVGKNLVTQKDIVAKEIVFPKHIYKSHVDTISGTITLQLRKLSKNGKVLDLNGLIVSFDLNSDKVKWTKKIEYSTSYLQQYKNVILETRGNKIERLNMENGDKLWSLKNYLYYVDDKNKLGIGYEDKGLTGDIHTLAGFNLNDGTIIWERDLNRAYGWNKIQKLNDSSVVVVSGGLHLFNIKTGLGWDYTTITGKKDYTETIAKNVGGMVLGALTGTVIFAYGSNIVKDLVSNLVIDSTNMYLASKEKIAKIDKTTGNIVWSSQLPEELTSKSNIIIKDSLLYLINYGFAYFRNKQIDFGAPFIAAFNKNTGQQLFLKTIDEKIGQILDYKIRDNHIITIYKDRVSIHSISDGYELSEKVFNIEDLGELSNYTSDRIYATSDDGILTNVVSSDTTKLYIQTNKGNTLVLDNDLNITHQYDVSKSNFHSLTKNNYKFFLRGKQTIIINQKNQIVAELNLSDYPYIIGSTIYDTDDESFLEIDLSEILRN